MYPYLKLATTLIKARFRPPLNFNDTGVLNCRVGFFDIDPYLELNHARQISLMELGRWDFSMRMGFLELWKAKKWGLTVGGISMRYRHRVPLFKAFKLTTKVVCHDQRWFYFLQEIICGDRICSSALIKAGVVSKSGLVNAPEIFEALGKPDTTEPMPAWVAAWIAGEGQRPWPKKAD